MVETKRHGEREPLRGFFAFLTELSCENRWAFRSICFMLAVGLLLVVVITTVPLGPDRLVRVSFGDYRAAAIVQEYDGGDLIAGHGAADVSIPELEELNETLALLAAADEIRMRNANGTGAFSAYCTTLTADEAQVKLDAIAAAKARAEAVERARAAVTVNTGYTSYVRFNTKGVPMSQKGTVEVDENGVPLHYSRKIVGNATAYYGGTRTATGTRPMPGTVAVNPRLIPYGTRMYITSADGRIVYGLAVAEDTGGFIYFRNGATVDLYMNTYEDCCGWGWRAANIYILD